MDREIEREIKTEAERNTQRQRQKKRHRGRQSETDRDKGRQSETTFMFQGCSMHKADLEHSVSLLSGHDMWGDPWRVVS